VQCDAVAHLDPGTVARVSAQHGHGQPRDRSIALRLGSLSLQISYSMGLEGQACDGATRQKGLASTHQQLRACDYKVSQSSVSEFCVVPKS
jgi:hypothetical protein